MKKIIYNISIDWPLIIKIAFLFFCLISTIQKYLYKEGLVRTLHQGRNLCVEYCQSWQLQLDI